MTDLNELQKAAEKAVSDGIRPRCDPRTILSLIEEIERLEIKVAALEIQNKRLIAKEGERIAKELRRIEKYEGENDG